MARKYLSILPGILVIVAGMMVISMAIPALAAVTDMETKAAHDEGDIAANTHDLVRGTHVEGHIAFMKAELGITAEQEMLWGPVASAMREDVKKLQEAERKVARKPTPDNALEYLENRVTFANLRAEGEVRFLNAFRPLYNSLSPQQKQIADDLLIPSQSE